MKSRLPAEYTSKGANNMIKQAQQMQANMATLQDELKTREYEGTAGGSMVKIKVNGEYEVLSVEIKPEVINPDDAEMLCDLVSAATNSAITAAKEDSEKEMSSITGGLNLGGLF